MSVSKLVKLRIYENEALECQDCNSFYPYVLQEVWPNKNELGEQYFDHTQISLDIEVCDGFTMDYHVALFFDLDEIIMPRDEVLDKITKRLVEMKILLGDEVIR